MQTHMESEGTGRPGEELSAEQRVQGTEPWLRAGGRAGFGQHHRAEGVGEPWPGPGEEGRRAESRRQQGCEDRATGETPGS